MFLFGRNLRSPLTHIQMSGGWVLLLAAIVRSSVSLWNYDEREKNGALPWLRKIRFIRLYGAFCSSQKCQVSIGVHGSIYYQPASKKLSDIANILGLCLKTEVDKIPFKWSKNVASRGFEPGTFQTLGTN